MKPSTSLMAALVLPSELHLNAWDICEAATANGEWDSHGGELLRAPADADFLLVAATRGG